MYLVLITGGQVSALPQPLGVDDQAQSSVANTGRDRDGHKSFKKTKKSAKPIKKSKEWIVNKKEQGRKKGL